MVRYLNRFLSHLEDLMKLGAKQQNVFERKKISVSTAPILAHYGPDLLLVVQCN